MIQNTLEEDNSKLPQKKDKKPKPINLPVQGVLLGLGLGVVLTLVGTQIIASPQETESTATPPVAIESTTKATPVTIASVETGEVKRTLKATGTVAAFELIPVLSQATGLQIRQVLVDEGDYVQPGQLLALLDDSVLQAELAQAKAAVAGSQARLAELRAGTRPEEIGQAQATVNSAQAAVIQAESDLELAKKRVARNQDLQAQSAIALDRLDEIINDQRTKQSNLDQAQARLRETEQRLAQLQAGPRQEVILQVEAQLAQDQARLQLVSAQLNYTRVIAPVAGKIAQRNARIGDVSSNSRELFTIIENGRLQLELTVPETELPQIQPGQTVEISSNGLENGTISGKVREINPIVTEASRQAVIEVDLPATDNLKPGMFLTANIKTTSVTGLTVPMKAILPQADGSAIAYVIQPDNTVTRQKVELGEILPGDRVEIIRGLEKGEQIVVKGAAYLKEGDRVDIDNTYQ